MARQQQLVCQQLENISSVVLEEYRDIIRHYIRGRNGAYALYKREKLYYHSSAKRWRAFWGSSPARWSGATAPTIGRCLRRM